MDKLVDGLLNSVLKGLYETPSKGAYMPTLVIGLGGTGLKVVRTLKKCLSYHSEQRVKLLGIDSDETENNKYPELPSLDAKELCLLNQGVAIRALAKANAGQAEYKHILDFLPDSYKDYPGLHQVVLQKVQTKHGAGQFRRAGRLLFDTNVNGGANLNRRLQEAKEELAGLSTLLNKEIAGVEIGTGRQVFVVSSATGGTGSGVLPDCLALIRMHFNSDSDMVSVFVVLPGSALDSAVSAPREERINTRGNALGLLRELQSLRLGEVKHKFVFDGELSFDCESTTSLFNSCYLIDNTLSDGTLIKSYMEICRALGYFLYSLVGTGIGAAKDSTGLVTGSVAGEIEETKQWKAIPEIFSGLGIGVLEYPIDDLGHFGMQYAMDGLLKDWLSEKYDTKNMLAEVAQTLNSMVCNNLASLRDRINFSPQEAKYLTGGAGENAVRHESDSLFIGAGRAKRSQIDAQLNDYNDELSQKTMIIIENVLKVLDERSREIITGNQAFAKAYSEKLIASLMDLRLRLLEEQKKRSNKFEDYTKTFEQLEAKINFWDLYLDRKLRRRYLQEMNAYLGLKIEAKLHNCVSDILSAAIKKANEINTSILNISLGFDNIQRLNKDRINSTICNVSKLSFIQCALPYEKFETWIRQVKLPVRQRFTASKLNEETVLGEALQEAGPELLRKLKSLDIIKDAQNDKSILNRVKSLNTSSLPLMYFVKEGPLEQDLKPTKFVAGNIRNSEDPFLEHFPPPPNGTCVGIPTVNPHILICSRLWHGFGIAHWAEYKAALRCYRAREWYYHAFGVSDDITVIEKTTQEEDDKLEIFGLGMMFDFIIKRGSNYYRNMASSEDGKAYFYLTYQKNACIFGEKLSAEGRIQPALKSEVRPRPENRIGEGILEAKDSMGTPELSSFVRDVQDLAMDFIAVVGKTEARTAITSYIDNVLVNEMLSTEKISERRELLKKIAEILKKYAASIR